MKYLNLKQINIYGKKTLENLTGTSKSYKPGKISKSTKNKKYDTWKN